ncbi:MAG: hypothetical protein AB1425_06300 [Actinomycetota bacterium]|nr:hypothetical protein [Rubrobacter sp.]
MSESRHAGGLEIGQDLRFQRRMWAIQRIGWAVMALSILAALLGLFGGAGPLSVAVVGKEEAPISVEQYYRFLRYGAPTTLRVHVDAPPGTGGEVCVWIDREYLESVQVQSVTPEPARVEAGSGRLTYVFDAEIEPGQPTAFTFTLQPEKLGAIGGWVGLEGGPSVRVEQFVYP